MSLDSSAAGAAAAAVAVLLVMAALARLFPARPAPDFTSSLEQLQARYRRWELGLGFAAIAVCVPTGFGLWFALRGMTAAHAALAAPAEIAWVAGPAYWGVPAIMLAITLMMPFSDWAARRLLRERYAEYLAYLQLKTKMDISRVARLLVGGITAGCAVFIFLGLVWSVRVDPSGLAVHRYFSLSTERHSFNEVQAIRTAPRLIAPNGNLVLRREYVVEFAGGRSWSTNNVLAEPSVVEKRRLIELLCARSGVPVQEAEVLRKEEL